MDNNIIQLSRCSVLTLAAIKLKLSSMTIGLGIEGYQNDCAKLIFDCTVIYMKSVIRSMAKYKRKYKLVCPELSEKSEKNKNSTGNKESLAEKLRPWQVKTNLEAVKEENITFQDKNYSKVVGEEDNQRDENFGDAKLSECLKSGEDINIESPCLKRHSVDETSSIVLKRIKSTNNERLFQEKTVKKKTNDCIMTEIVCSPQKFNMRDFLEFLKMDTHVIPQRSVYNVFKTIILEKLNQKIRL